MSQKVWIAASFLNLPVLKVSNKGQENQFRRDAMLRVFSLAGIQFNNLSY